MHKVQNKKLLAFHKIAAGHPIPFRPLSDDEIQILKKQNNRAQNWQQVFINNNTTVAAIHNCRFNETVYIGCVEPGFIDGKGIRRARGLYDSYFENCLIGADCAIHNVGHLSGYVIGSNTLILNTSEISSSNQARFGMGTKLEIINENGGRAISIFRDISPGDAYLWGHYRALNGRFERFTHKLNTAVDDEPGKIGKGSVIKNCRLIHDCAIGANVYLHECDSLDNLTILSSEEEPTEIGEGVGLKNGLVGFSNKISSGARCDSFVGGRNVAIGNVARIAHTFVGDNSHIACAEVMNTLLFPFHEQHHNNSFLIACAIGGQANIAAGAIIGSNHNSRAADGEIWAERGFWPGLATDFKHNSRFAAFALIAKASYEHEMEIPFPFCLIGRSYQTGQITIMPGYWFRYNMYALARNAWKFTKRDQRVCPRQIIETAFMAPDTIAQIYHAVRLLLKITDGKYLKTAPISGICPKQESLLIKPSQGIELYQQMLAWHTARKLVDTFAERPQELKYFNHKVEEPDAWENVGGQLIRGKECRTLLQQVADGHVTSWSDVHDWYKLQAESYDTDHLETALNAWASLSSESPKNIRAGQVSQLLKNGMKIGAKIVQWAMESRKKDYENDFRMKCFADKTDMDRIIGRLEDNPFLNELQQDHQRFCDQSEVILTLLEK